MFLGHNVQEGVRDPEHDEAGTVLGVVADLRPLDSPVFWFDRLMEIEVESLEMFGDVFCRGSNRVFLDDLFSEAN